MHKQNARIPRPIGPSAPRAVQLCYCHERVQATGRVSARHNTAQRAGGTVQSTTMCFRAQRTPTSCTYQPPSARVCESCCQSVP